MERHPVREVIHQRAALAVTGLLSPLSACYNLMEVKIGGGL